MAFPLIPFAAGIAVGALAAYGFKDEAVRDTAEKSGRWLYDTLAGAYEAVAGALGGVFGSGAVSAEGPAAAPPAEPSSAAQSVSETHAPEQPTTPAV